MPLCVQNPSSKMHRVLESTLPGGGTIEKIPWNNWNTLMSDVYGGKSTLTLAKWKCYTFVILLTMAHSIPCYAMKPYKDQKFTTKENFIIAVKHVSIAYERLS